MKTHLVWLTLLTLPVTACRYATGLEGFVSATVEQHAVITQSDGTKMLNADVRFRNTGTDAVIFEPCSRTVLQRQDNGSVFVDASTFSNCGATSESDTSIAPDSERVFPIRLAKVIEGSPGIVYRINLPVFAKGYGVRTVYSETFTLPAT